MSFWLDWLEGCPFSLLFLSLFRVVIDKNAFVKVAFWVKVVWCLGPLGSFPIGEVCVGIRLRGMSPS